ncbi:MAG: hypothetical protein IT373_10305, partial [Polyangiaceae bacterium]|nr:hypothetical protein [Polyangiaceae bacterium]
RKTTRCGVETAAKNGASDDVRQRIAASEPDCLRACREDGPPADTDVPELRTCLQQDCGAFMTCLQRAMGQK